MSHKWDVFVSYSRRDLAVVSKIIADLRSAGLRVWQDETNIDPGDRLRDQIDDGIRNSACIVIVLSVNSLKSRWVLNELDAAMLREIRDQKRIVIPIAIGNVDPQSLPVDLQGKRFIDLRFNFPKRYAAYRKELVSTVWMGTRSTADFAASAPIRLGPEAVSFIFSQEYWQGHRITDLYDSHAIKFIDLLVDGMFLNDESRDAWRFGDPANFIQLYGREAARRIIMFFFDHHGVHGFEGFTIEEIDKVFEEVDFFVFGIQSYEHSLKTLGMYFEFGIQEDGSIVYRIRRQDVPLEND